MTPVPPEFAHSGGEGSIRPRPVNQKRGEHDDDGRQHEHFHAD
jgi:hypothetical protein